MRRTWLIATLLLCGALVAVVYAQPWQLTPVAGDFDPHAPLSRGLLSWLVVLPHQAGGPMWYAATGFVHGALTTLGLSSGWAPSPVPGWYGAMKFNGTTAYMSLGLQPAMACADRTCTLSLDVTNMTDPGTGNVYLLANHPGGLGQGYILRVSAAGVVLFRLYTGGGTSAGECSTVTLNLYDGKKHNITVVFTTDTVTAANSTAILYVDGVVDMTAFGSAAGPYEAPTTIPFTLFALPDPIGYAQGYLLNFRFYTRGLAAPEVAALARAAAPTFGGSFVLPPLSLAGTLAPVAPKRKVVIQ